MEVCISVYILYVPPRSYLHSCVRYVNAYSVVLETIHRPTLQTTDDITDITDRRITVA